MIILVMLNTRFFNPYCFQPSSSLCRPSYSLFSGILACISSSKILPFENFFKSTLLGGFFTVVGHSLCRYLSCHYLPSSHRLTGKQRFSHSQSLFPPHPLCFLRRCCYYLLRLGKVTLEGSLWYRPNPLAFFPWKELKDGSFTTSVGSALFDIGDWFGFLSFMSYSCDMPTP
uniref:Putative uncharacterized protein YCL022C n=1 Tax=Saccharomyces cerevisiae (strain ATCC 204508 / S288c) TaxID=559292 RepID=YCC2_YEAST|nr:RecName: Full=Putative uncharacterized protein YCL022C [Saccharomyces cerevisiae S288C]